MYSNVIAIQSDRCYCRVYLKRVRQGSPLFNANVIIIQISPCHCFMYY